MSIEEYREYMKKEDEKFRGFRLKHKKMGNLTGILLNMFFKDK